MPAVTREAGTAPDESVPTDVREEVTTTVELRVVPVRVPAGAVPVMLPVKLPVAVVKKRLVVLAVVAKKLVEVAFVVVLFRPVKFWRVVEPVTKRLERVVRPLVAESVPGKT